MKETLLYNQFQKLRKQGRKAFAVLIDPDRHPLDRLGRIIALAEEAGVDYFFVGSSLLFEPDLDNVIGFIKKNSAIPVILFPGNHLQISKQADAILLLSLISGRNPELLIGQHVIAAPALKDSGLEIIPTGYLLIEGGMTTSVSYISNSMPIPANKNDIAAATAMAGEMLGLQAIYLEAGSGAKNPVSQSMIREVRNHIQVPLIAGGGINTPEKAIEHCIAGADIIVVGNKLEQDLGLISDMAFAIHSSVAQSETA